MDRSGSVGAEGEARSAAVRAVGVTAPSRRRGAAAGKEGKPYVLFEALPPHQRDNKYIRGYYRSEYTVKRSLRSVLELHNETGNIWTHLIGAVLFLVLLLVTPRLAPRPIALGADALRALETRISEHGARSLYDLASAVGNLEGRLASAGGAAEQRLRSLDPRELLDGGLRRFSGRLAGLSSSVGSLRDAAGDAAQRVQDAAGDAAQRVHDAAGDAARGVQRVYGDADRAVHRAVAEVLGGQWPAQRWPLGVFLAGAVVCMCASTVCHLLGCCAAHISQRIWRVDYAGIAVLIVASYVPPLFYGFQCEPAVRAAYMTATVTLGLIVVVLSLAPRFQKPDFYLIRVTTFVLLGAWGAVPTLHFRHAHAGDQGIESAVRLMLTMGGVYLLGAALYALRVPERFGPGRFDRFGHSHQLFHVAVVAGAFVHYVASRKIMDWQDARGGCLAAL